MDETTLEVKNIYWVLILLMLGGALQGLTYHWFYHHVMIDGLHARTALQSGLYAKLMKMQQGHVSSKREGGEERVEEEKKEGEEAVSEAVKEGEENEVDSEQKKKEEEEENKEKKKEEEEEGGASKSLEGLAILNLQSQDAKQVHSNESGLKP